MSCSAECFGLGRDEAAGAKCFTWQGLKQLGSVRAAIERDAADREGYSRRAPPVSVQPLSVSVCSLSDGLILADQSHFTESLVISSMSGTNKHMPNNENLQINHGAWVEPSQTSFDRGTLQAALPKRIL